MGLLTPKTRTFHRIGNRYANLFNEEHFLGRSAFEDSWMAKPPTNVKHKEGKLVVEIAMPGFNKDEIFIEVKDDTLHISAQKKLAEKEGKYVAKEVPDRIEPQVIHLAKDVDQEKVEAHLINGMLQIEIPHTKTPNHISKSISVTD